jgi:hypothetical protein
MNKDLDRRVRKLEQRYAARRSSRQVIGIRFLTADEISRGLGPGLRDEDFSSPAASDGAAAVETRVCSRRCLPSQEPIKEESSCR